ncbi:MAG: DUF402 domain-containing protein [Brachybacterium sp.]|uniref:DUF402 domain-containing protein n=1 Tax=Brachybacterium sp. TaxID=1891286 RepID=UPI002648301C|nr:DUF402 domain-containing protein [Brachybacterium sp.]MDN5686877.1 DUF402 domain-containing protein [Brachybacterium sp.]
MTFSERVPVPEPDPPLAPFAPGKGIALRSIRNRPSATPAPSFAVAGTVLVDSASCAVVTTPVGSGMARRAGRAEGPRDRLVAPLDWDGTHEETTWKGATVVRVHPHGENWSIWRWHDGRSWTGDWYGNLECPWQRSPIGFDTQDWVLDVVGVGTPGTDAWDVSFKDDDELEYLLRIGATTSAEVERIREQGSRLREAFVEGMWPFDADWEQWLPSDDLGPVPLPVGWRELDHRAVHGG